MALDFQGNVVTVIQIVALLLLTIGVYPYRIRTKNRNLIIHGFLGITALALNLATVFYAMIPTFSASLLTFNQLSLSSMAAVLIHTGLGLAAILLGLVIIVSWITHPLGELSCSRTWKLMIPTFAIWATTLILGIIIYFFDLL
jgi:hypothetical protein